jgi:hypothetical protein
VTNPWPETPQLKFRHLAQFDVKLLVDDNFPYELGPTPLGQLRGGLISGGRIEGERLRARILGGMDNGMIRPDDTFAPNIRLICETDDGDKFMVSYQGFVSPFTEFLKARRREPSNVTTWRLIVTFATSAPAIEWLNLVHGVAVGTTVDGEVQMQVYELV